MRLAAALWCLALALRARSEPTTSEESLLEIHDLIDEMTDYEKDVRKLEKERGELDGAAQALRSQLAALEEMQASLCHAPDTRTDWGTLPVDGTQLDATGVGLAGPEAHVAQLEDLLQELAAARDRLRQVRKASLTPEEKAAAAKAAAAAEEAAVAEEAERRALEREAQAAEQAARKAMDDAATRLQSAARGRQEPDGVGKAQAVHVRISELLDALDELRVISPRILCPEIVGISFSSPPPDDRQLQE